MEYEARSRRRERRTGSFYLQPLTALGLGLGFVLLGGCAPSPQFDTSRANQPSILVANSSRELNDQHVQSIKARVIPITETNHQNQTPSLEQIGVTEEMLRQVSKSVYVIRIYGDQNTTISNGSLIKIEENAYYMMISGHALTNAGENFSGVTFSRPQMSDESIIPGKIDVVATYDDVAIIRCEGKLDATHSVINLGSDNKILPGDKLFMVGYSPQTPGKWYLETHSLEVSHKDSSQSNTSLAPGSMKAGSSGSPVFRILDEQISVVGIVRSNIWESKSTGSNLTKQSFIGINQVNGKSLE